ncbi:prolyl oligopeptidase family serine peptidase [Dactylosporangium sp. AC04546]|uniref:prolyl oligopeptidase family serine peptidase n=1 Tax=Dactylosporangium sp. AC04546 TaxID=2862460 RepID=UPI001EDEE04F|nr:prolyl oligopeptidase family serine peptidase [Dactylosporangium sp. AC04546]WVK84825.1 prolyl oligopeptidase family serine peptidase [Dactylosporangium sp. AC04546]
MDYPELAARTRRFSYGAPRAVTVSPDGARVVFLRSSGPEDPSDALWVYEVAARAERRIADPAALLRYDRDEIDLPAAERALRERLRLSAGGIGSFALDGAGVVAAFALGGRLFRADLLTGDVVELRAAGPVVDPRPDPTGRQIAYVTGGALHVIDADGTDALLAGEEGVTWGMAEFIGAEEFHRFRGYWWSPDGRSILTARVDESRVPRWHLQDPSEPDQAPTTVAYPYAGADNAKVTLHVLDLDGGWVDVHWDRETYPYLVAASWSDQGGPLLAVLRRLQQHGLVIAVDPRTGETQVHAELADPRWVEPVPGTPVHLADGRVLVGGELAHDGYDARCLFADGSLITPPNLYVRRVVGRLDGDLVVEASDGEPSEQHIFRIPITHSSAQAQRLTSEPGWHVAQAAGRTLIVGSQTLEHGGSQYDIHHNGEVVGEIASLAAAPPFAPRPVLERVTDRRVPTGVLYPRGHVSGRRLPVLVSIYGGPGHQEVIAARARWQEKQWWADAGFAVVSIDNRGTPGVAPSFDKAIHRRFSDVILTDQVDALQALAEKHPDLDLDRVAIRGWSFGGWLSALGVLRRPDVYRCAVVGAPVTDWGLYDTAYTERYLGLPAEAPEVYAHNSLVELAAEPPVRPDDARPMLLIHGLVDDNVVAAHTLRLSAALLGAGRPHSMIPLTGATHMAAGGLAEKLLRIELDFIRRSIG